MADSLLAQLRKFLVETNAFALAIAVVIGGAVSKLVGVLVSALIMPIVAMFLPTNAVWQDWTIPLFRGQAIAIGALLSATIDFIIIAFVVFVMASKIFRVEVKK